MPDVKPQRIQLKREKGWRMPPNTVKVDRSTRWGNPFRVEAQGRTAIEAVRMFRQALLGGDLSISVDDVRAELGGKSVACWCAPGDECHGDVLLEVANPRRRWWQRR